jgi:hypothetical protein
MEAWTSSSENIGLEREEGGVTIVLKLAALALSLWMVITERAKRPMLSQADTLLI